MPEYEFECTDERCACRFRVYYGWKTADGINFVDDPNMQNCVECGERAEQLYSLTVMRPDTHWRGVYFETTDYHSTSKAKYDRWCKHHWENDMERSFVEVGDRTDKEGLAKDRESAGRSRDRKREKILEDFLIEELAGVEFNYESHVITKESRREEERRRNAESAAPEDVFIDPAFM